MLKSYNGSSRIYITFIACDPSATTSVITKRLPNDPLMPVSAVAQRTARRRRTFYRLGRSVDTELTCRHQLLTNVEIHNAHLPVSAVPSFCHAPCSAVLIASPFDERRSSAPPFGADPGRWPLPAANDADANLAARRGCRRARADTPVASPTSNGPPRPHRSAAGPLASLALSTRASFLRQLGRHVDAARDGTAAPRAGGDRRRGACRRA